MIGEGGVYYYGWTTCGGFWVTLGAFALNQEPSSFLLKSTCCVFYLFFILFLLYLFYLSFILILPLEFCMCVLHLQHLLGELQCLRTEPRALDI